MTERKRKGGRFVALLAILVAAVVALYARCGEFFGFDVGDGSDTTMPPGEPAELPEASDAAVVAEELPPCELRIDATGLMMEGEAITDEAALEACKPSGRAILRVTGDTRYGELERVRAFLEAAAIEVSSTEGAPRPDQLE